MAGSRSPDFSPLQGPPEAKQCGNCVLNLFSQTAAFLQQRSMQESTVSGVGGRYFTRGDPFQHNLPPVPQV